MINHSMKHMKWLLLSCFFALATAPAHGASFADLDPQIFKAENQPDFDVIKKNLKILSSVKKPHTVFGLPANTENVTLKTYRTFCLAWHPDKTSDKPFAVFARQVFDIIGASFEYYKNEKYTNKTRPSASEKADRRDGIAALIKNVSDYLKALLSQASQAEAQDEPVPRPIKKPTARPTTPRTPPSASAQQHRTTSRPYTQTPRKQTYQPQTPAAPQPASTEPKVDREAAVRRIQATQRAAARKRAQQRAADAKVTEEKEAQEKQEALRNAAAATIQRTYNGYVARRDSREAKQAHQAVRPTKYEPSQSQRASAATTTQRAYRAHRNEQVPQATSTSNVTTITLQGLMFTLVDENKEFFFPSVGTNFAGKRFAAKPDDHRAAPELLTPLLLNRQERILVFTQLFKAGIAKEDILKTLRLYNPETEEWFDVSDNVQDEIEIAYSIAFEQPSID